MQKGLYTESIKKRIKNDTEIKDSLSDLRDVIDRILAAYGRTSTFNGEADDPDELMEYVMEPAGILYEKIDMTDPSWKENTDFIIAFLKDGSPILITQALFGHHYECPGRHQKGRLTEKIGLGGTGYAVYRPLDDTEFNFRTYIRHILKNVPAKFWVVICVLSGLAAVLNLAAPFISRKVLKEYVPIGRQATSYILLAILIFAVAGILIADQGSVAVEGAQTLVDFIVQLEEIKQYGGTFLQSAGVGPAFFRESLQRFVFLKPCFITFKQIL